MEADRRQSGQARRAEPGSALPGAAAVRNFNRRHWKPAQKTVGIEPLRDLNDLRHTYATYALRAGVPVFALSRFMGTSIAMIDLKGLISSDFSKPSDGLEPSTPSVP